MKVLVTGGAGFIGSHLLRELADRDYDITVIDDLSTGKKSNLKGLKVKLWAKRIQDIKTTQKFDLIWHLAAKANTRETGMKDFIDNVMATEAVVKMLNLDGHIYFASSCAVYGNQPIVNEDSFFRPISPYGYSKWMNELTIVTTCRPNYTIFRFSNVFGERQDGSNEMGLIGVIEYCLKHNKTLKVFNRGNNYRDYIYVKDVVKALTTPRCGVYQVGSNKTHKTLDLVKLSKVKWVYGKCNNEVKSIRLENLKLQKENWEPTLNVKDYIRGLK